MRIPSQPSSPAPLWRSITQRRRTCSVSVKRSRTSWTGRESRSPLFVRGRRHRSRPSPGSSESRLPFRHDGRECGQCRGSGLSRDGPRPESGRAGDHQLDRLPGQSARATASGHPDRAVPAGEEVRRSRPGEGDDRGPTLDEDVRRWVDRGKGHGPILDEDSRSYRKECGKTPCPLTVLDRRLLDLERLTLLGKVGLAEGSPGRGLTCLAWFRGRRGCTGSPG